MVLSAPRECQFSGETQIRQFGDDTLEEMSSVEFAHRPHARGLPFPACRSTRMFPRLLALSLILSVPRPAHAVRTELNGRALTSHASCEPGTFHDSSADVCVDCPVGQYTSGRKPVCRFLDLTDYDCSSYFNPTTFQTKFGFSDVVGAECDFGTAKTTYTLFEQSTATCSFADVAFSECTGSATIDAQAVVTFRMSCDIDEGDIVFQTCRDNLVGNGSRVECTWEGGLEDSCTACPPGTLCSSTSTIDPPPCFHGLACDGASMSACLAGSYSTGGLAACLNCPNGSTCPLDGWGEPSKCPAKYYSGTGATQCEECWAGHACPTEATEWPVRCLEGYYAPATSEQCSQCAPGATSDAGSSECSAMNCSASSDSAKNGTDGSFYCIHGGTVGGTAGACTCAGCDAGYNGASCQNAITSPTPASTPANTSSSTPANTSSPPPPTPPSFPPPNLVLDDDDRAPTPLSLFLLLTMTALVLVAT